MLPPMWGAGRRWRRRSQRHRRRRVARVARLWPRQSLPPVRRGRARHARGQRRFIPSLCSRQSATPRARRPRSRRAALGRVRWHDDVERHDDAHRPRRFAPPGSCAGELGSRGFSTARLARDGGARPVQARDGGARDGVRWRDGNSALSSAARGARMAEGGAAGLKTWAWTSVWACPTRPRSRAFLFERFNTHSHTITTSSSLAPGVPGADPAALQLSPLRGAQLLAARKAM
jgi:hypothetical protein